jgi:hypothetical protein
MSFGVFNVMMERDLKKYQNFWEKPDLETIHTRDTSKPPSKQNIPTSPYHQDSLLHISFSRIHNPLSFSFIPTTTRGAHSSSSPFPFYPPHHPPSLSHPAGSSAGTASPTPSADGGGGGGCPASQAATTKCRPRAAATRSATSRVLLGGIAKPIHALGQILSPAAAAISRRSDPQPAAPPTPPRLSPTTRPPRCSAS